MELYALSNQYNTKLLGVLNEMEAINSDLTKNLINQINDYFKKIQKTIYAEAFISGGCGLAAGFLGVGTAFMPDAEKIKQAFQACIPLISKGGEFGATLARGKETTMQLKERLMQEHLLVVLRELKGQYENGRHTMEQKLSDCMRLKGEGDRLH